MAQYIDKAALVAEIERLKKCNWEICAGNFEFLKECYPGYYYSTEAYNDILSFLDTIEVKEVDLNMFVEQKQQFIDKACRLMQHWILEHDYVDIIELEDYIKQKMDE